MGLVTMIGAKERSSSPHSDFLFNWARRSSTVGGSTVQAWHLLRDRDDLRLDIRFDLAERWHALPSITTPS